MTSDFSLTLNPPPLDTEYNVNITLGTPHGQLKLTLKNANNGPQRSPAEDAEWPAVPSRPDPTRTSVHDTSVTASVASRLSDGMCGHADCSLSACIATGSQHIQAAREPSPLVALEHENHSATATESEGEQTHHPHDTGSTSSGSESPDYDRVTYSYLMAHSAPREFLQGLSPSPRPDPATPSQSLSDLPSVSLSQASSPILEQTRQPSDPSSTSSSHPSSPSPPLHLPEPLSVHAPYSPSKASSADAPAATDAAVCDSDCDTVSEHDPLEDAYDLGYSDGRREGRNDALRFLRLGWVRAQTPPAKGGGAIVDEGDTLVADMESPPTFVPFPNLRTGCHLTPRTRKRIAVELPPSPVTRHAVKRLKEQLAPDVLALVYPPGRRA